mmetsp:Transcript_12771/g.42661  ORF Transcript_12771/g.42661 Transcript_12771/m.42661 type:complete len:213 (-) Transcript_12771:2539-3177(-)
MTSCGASAAAATGFGARSGDRYSSGAKAPAASEEAEARRYGLVRSGSSSSSPIKMPKTSRETLCRATTSITACPKPSSSMLPSITPSCRSAASTRRAAAAAARRTRTLDSRSAWAAVPSSTRSARRTASARASYDGPSSANNASKMTSKSKRSCSAARLAAHRANSGGQNAYTACLGPSASNASDTAASKTAASLDLSTWARAARVAASTRR